MHGVLFVHVQIWLGWWNSLFRSIFILKIFFPHYEWFLNVLKSLLFQHQNFLFIPLFFANLQFYLFFCEPRVTCCLAVEIKPKFFTDRFFSNFIENSQFNFFVFNSLRKEIKFIVTTILGVLVYHLQLQETAFHFVKPLRIINSSFQAILKYRDALVLWVCFLFVVVRFSKIVSLKILLVFFCFWCLVVDQTANL